MREQKVFTCSPDTDLNEIIKKSDENPLVQELYAGLLKGKEHELLHNEFY